MFRKLTPLFLVVLLFGLTVSLNSAVPPTLQEQSQTLRNSDVLDLLKSGLSPDIIIAKIKASPCKFDTSSATLADLKKGGVPEAIIMAMVLAPGDGSRAPQPAPGNAAAPTGSDPAPGGLAPRVTSVPAKPREEDPVLSRMPAQAGMYYLRGTDLTKVDVKTLASAKTAGRLGHVLTLGVKSVKTNAYLIGPSAKTRLQETSPIFYLRLPEGVSIDEIALVNLLVKADRRELEVSAQSGFVGAKQGLRMEALRQFESEELAPGVYKIAPNILGKGEYLFYVVGSADAVKGIQGKGYDFSVQ